MKTKLELFSNLFLLAVLAVVLISKIHNVDRARLTPTRSTASIRELGTVIPIKVLQNYIKGEDEVEITTENSRLVKASWRDYQRRVWHFSAKLNDQQKWRLEVITPSISKPEKMQLEKFKTEVLKQSKINQIEIVRH